MAELRQRPMPGGRREEEEDDAVRAGEVEEEKEKFDVRYDVDAWGESLQGWDCVLEGAWLQS